MPVYGPVFISMAFTAEQLYGVYKGLCPIEYTIKDAETKQTLTRTITTECLQQEDIHFPFDYNTKHRDDPCLRYLCKKRLLCSPLTTDLVIGKETVRFFECGTVGHLITQAPRMGHVLEQALRCYEASITDPSFIGYYRNHSDIWDTNPILEHNPGAVAHRIPPTMRLQARLIFRVEIGKFKRVTGRKRKNAGNITTRR